MISQKILNGLNEEQQKAVQTINNCVVAAGAGSGKTRVLARRYAYLIVEKKLKVDQILTLTFTKKATNEMYERIYQTLCGIEDDNAREAVENFGDARIFTIDAYCSQLVKNCSNEYGVRPDFSVDPEGVAKLAESLALKFVLSYKEEEVFKYLNRKMNLRQIASGIFANTVVRFSCVCNPINFSEQLDKQCETILFEWNNNNKELELQIENIKTMLESFDRSASRIDASKQVIQSIENKHNIEPEIPLLNETKIQNYLSYLNSLTGMQSAGNVKWDLKDEYNQRVDVLKKTVGKIKNILNFVLNYEEQKKLIPLLEEFQMEFNKQKRIQGLMTFNDVSKLALKILSEKKEIRQLEKKRTKAIMIDEFQDDNSEQKDMLFYLSEKLENFRTDGVPHPDELEKDKLFFVGDEKQSIYRFRGADVSVFKKLSDELKNGEQLTLSRNYRSTPQLIASFNSIFGGESYPPESNKSKIENVSVFDKPSKDLKDYEAVYKNARTKEEDEDNTKWNHNVHFAFIEKDYDKDEILEEDVLEPKEIEAAYVAKKIKTIIDEGNYRPSDICILFRKYNEQYLFEKYLRYYRLPYLTQTFVGIFGDGPANDLFSFLKICCLPQDLKAYATVLASPFVNLKSSTIEKLISNYDGIAFDEKAECLLFDTELSRYKKAKELYEIYSEQFMEQSLTKTITNLWYDLGYRYETLWNNTVYRFSELYDLIYELACEAEEEGKGLYELVESAEKFKGESEKLGEVDVTTEHEDAISIMSVHKSKGLEFPIVFVCSMQQQSRNLSEENVFYSEENGLSINLPKSKYLINDEVKNYFFCNAKDEIKAKDLAELKRLMYVAFTRAEKELYVTGVYNSKKADSMLDLLLPVIEYYDNSSLETKNWPFELDSIPVVTRKDFNFEKSTDSDKIGLIKFIEEKFKNTHIVTKDIVPKNHFTPSHLHETDDDDETYVDKKESKEKMSDELYEKIDEIIFETIDDKLQKPKFTFANFGTIAHAFMEAAVLGKDPIILQKDIKFLSNRQQETVFEICKKFSDLFLQTELGKKALSSSWAKTEYTFKSKISKMILTGSVDLTFEDETGKIIIVDYKTNKEIKPEIYYQQLAAYRKALSEIKNVPLENIKCYLYYLRYAKIADITEECKSVNLEEVLNNAENI